MKKHIKLISIVAASLLLFTIGIIAGCKKEESSSNLDKQTQESFKELEKMMELSNQREKEKKQFESQKNNIIFVEEIPRVFAPIGVTNFLRMNNNHPVYQLVDKKDLNTYLIGLRGFYLDNKVLDWYSKGVFDCGDYAMGATWYAKAWHRNTKTRIDGASIAVGTIFYKQDSTGIYHAINAVILKDRSVLFFEPQIQNEISLSKAEIQSINYVQF